MKIKKEDKNRCLRFNKRHETKVSISYSRSHWHATLFLLIDQLEIVFFFFFFILMAKLFDRFFSRERKPQSHETIVTIIFSTKKTLKFFFPRRTILFTSLRVYLFSFWTFCLQYRSSYRCQFVNEKNFFVFSYIERPWRRCSSNTDRGEDIFSNLSWITLTAQRNQI